MTESTIAHNHYQPHVHVFNNGVLTNTLPAYDDWSTIEADLTRVKWEEVLSLFPNQDNDLPAAFFWG
jgi:hypothetical protein